jgi:hypothetical protein
MRKTLLIMFAIFLVFGGCTDKNSQKGKPSAVVMEFNKYIKEGKAEMAYSLFSQTIKKKLSLENFTKTVKPSKAKEELDELLKNFEIQIDNEEIKGNQAYVFGSVKMLKGESYFRQKCALEYNAWKIDSEVMEDRHPNFQEFYRDIDLHKVFAVYCESLLDGKAETMYDMSSTGIKALYTLDSFSQATISTGSEKTPRQERFKVEALYAYSDDKNNGICIMKLGNPASSSKDLQSGILFKLPWKFEDGAWKADFAKIDESFKIGLADQ